MSAGPAYLPPDWRYAGNDWAGANAFTYVVSDPPIYAADGITIVTPGAPRSLVGCTVTGLLRYQSRCAAPAPAVARALPIPVGAVLDAAGGIIALSLLRAQAIFQRQSLALWPDPTLPPPDPTRALLIVEPQVIDAAGNLVSIGLQQLFVF